MNHRADICGKKPEYHYSLGSAPLPASRVRGSNARTVTHQDRSGVQLQGIHGRILIPEHTLNETEGSVQMWILPLADLYPATHHPQHGISNKRFDMYVFLSDREALREVDQSFFTLCYNSDWHPCLFAKFFQGRLLPDGVWNLPARACAMAGHFEFEALNWYAVALTWNHTEGRYRIYANGTLVGAEDSTAKKPFLHDACGPFLFAGNPSLALSDMDFYDTELSPMAIQQLFEKESTCTNTAIQSKLEKHWEGKNLPAFDSHPEHPWEEKLSLSLTRKTDLEEFFLQGGTNTVTVNSEGLHIKTPPLEDFVAQRSAGGPEPAGGFDNTRMYLWSHRIFEGDLYVRFDFQIKEHGGLCLLIAHASGMQGEDFLNDYFLRADGRMSVVCWEDVRNYHWEFYREICDVRNDRVSHAMLKNPWFKPMAFQVEDRKWETDRWYRFEYVQIGSTITGGIDGIQVIDAKDSGFDNNGPVFCQGRIAIRCMMRSNMLFRNLVVKTAPHFKVGPILLGTV